jgi:hypothetical protein
MSFIHYLFLGHFEHDGALVRFSKRPDDPVYRPVIRRSLDTAVLRAVFLETTGRDVDEITFPDDWMVWMDDGYLVCDKYTRNPEVIDFITRLAERTRCDLHDVGAHCDLALNDWLALTHSAAKP